MERPISTALTCRRVRLYLHRAGRLSWTVLDGWRLCRRATKALDGMVTVDGTALRMCTAGTLTKKLGWSAFTTQVPPGTFGDLTRLASLNGTESNGRISRNPRSGPARTGSTAASTSPISC